MRSTPVLVVLFAATLAAPNKPVMPWNKPEKTASERIEFPFELEVEPKAAVKPEAELSADAAPNIPVMPWNKPEKTASERIEFPAHQPEVDSKAEVQQEPELSPEVEPAAKSKDAPAAELKVEPEVSPKVEPKAKLADIENYVRATEKAAPVCTSYPCLVFEDTFDTFDLDTWQHEITAGGGGNWEFQYYTNNRSNSYTRDGTLFIKPTLTIDRFAPGFLGAGVLELWGTTPANLCTSNNWWGCRRQGTPTNYLNPVQSARLRTVNSFSMKYGRLEIEAKMPTGDWLWSALWMLPKHNYYGDWPASGEIDIAEAIGNRDLNNSAGQHVGVNAAGATLHWGPYMGQDKYYKTTAARHSDFGERFHKYTIEWDADGMRIYFDGDEIMTVEPGSGGFWEMGDFGMPANRNPWVHGSKMAPFDKEFYIAMNVAVGGTNGYFGDDWKNAGYQKPWNNKSPTAPRDFWNAKNDWYPTWNPGKNNGEDAAMQIRSIRAFKLAP